MRSLILLALITGIGSTTAEGQVQTSYPLNATQRSLFPDTPAGGRARDYFLAFAASPDSLEQYLKDALAPNPRNSPTIAQRVQRHLTLREQLLALTPSQVKSSDS